MSALEVEHLTKRYGDFTAVDDISFVVEAGECFGLLGPNGAGKSSTIHCLTGFYPTSAGTVRILGVDVHLQPKVARRKLGVCLQDDTLDSDFRVLDQMVRHATFFHIPVREGRPRAEELLRRFGLEEKRDEPVEALSGGMRRRLQVARALVNDPAVLVLDEPTTGLDPEVRRTVWDVLQDCRKRGVAVLLCTHYMEEAERLCDQVAIMHRGRLLDVAPPPDLIARHVGTDLVEETVREGVVWTRPPNLEDVYLRLTGHHLEDE